VSKPPSLKKKPARGEQSGGKERSIFSIKKKKNQEPCAFSVSRCSGANPGEGKYRDKRIERGGQQDKHYTTKPASPPCGEPAHGKTFAKITKNQQIQIKKKGRKVSSKKRPWLMWKDRTRVISGGGRSRKAWGRGRNNNQEQNRKGPENPKKWKKRAVTYLETIVTEKATCCGGGGKPFPPATPAPLRRKRLSGRRRTRVTG